MPESFGYAFLKQLFDLSRYQGTAELSATQWYNVLTWRKSYRAHYLDKDPVRPEALSYLVQTLARPLAPAEMMEPSFGKKAWRSVAGMSTYDLLVAADSVDFPADGRSRRELARMHARSDEEYWESAKAGEESFIETSVLEYHLGRDIGLTDYVPVSVDLAATDDRILMDFTAWLATARALVKQHSGKDPPPKRFSQAEFGKWHSNRVLPYIDIRLFSDLLGVPLTQQQIGDLLFPDDLDANVAEKIRKTVIPAATELMSYRVLEALQGQASAEAWPVA